LFWLTTCILWKAELFFFLAKFRYLSTKKLGFLWIFFLVLVRIQLILLIFLVKFCQIFNMKKMKKKKKTLESRVSFKDFMM
jgi:membrane protein insertase Oxa1/YidC/SpoIIIJ